MIHIKKKIYTPSLKEKLELRVYYVLCMVYTIDFLVLHNVVFLLLRIWTTSVLPAARSSCTQTQLTNVLKLDLNEMISLFVLTRSASFSLVKSSTTVTRRNASNCSTSTSIITIVFTHLYNEIKRNKFSTQHQHLKDIIV